MTSSLVFMHDALSDHFVDHRQCLDQCAAGAISVLSLRKNPLNVSSHRGALASVVGAAFFGLRHVFLLADC